MKCQESHFKMAGFDRSLTEHLDYWSEQKVNFGFGFDAKSMLVKLAKNVEDEDDTEIEYRPRKCD